MLCSSSCSSPIFGGVVVRLIDTPGAYGRVWHLASDSTTTQPEVIARIERMETHDLLTEPLLLDDTALHTLHGPIVKTSYDDGVHAMLALRDRA